MSGALAMQCTSHVNTWVRFHQPLSRTVFVFFPKIWEFECNITPDWLNRIWFIQSEVLFHSNAYKYRNFWRTRLKNVLKNCW